MRANPTEFEQKLLPMLRNIKGANFTDQVVKGGYILDFYCDPLKLAVELDGNNHNIHSDTTRDAQLYSMFGISTMRFPNPKDGAALNTLLFDVRAECRWRLGRIRRGISTFPNRLSLTTDKDESAAVHPVETCEYVQKPGACTRQVFATVETASVTAVALRTLGIDATVERCQSCKLIHLRERRIILPPILDSPPVPQWTAPRHYEVFNSVEALKKVK